MAGLFPRQSLPTPTAPAFLMMLAMAIERVRAQQALRRSHEDLERRVAERTEELNRANQELSPFNEEIYAMNEELTENSRKLGEEIEKRKKSELELQAANQKIISILENVRLSEERFSKAFHASPIIGVIRLLDGDLNLDVNDNFLKVLEYERSEVVGCTPRDAGYWVDESAYDKTLKELKIRGECRDEEVELRTKSGKIIKALFSAFKTEINGEPCAIISFVDITDRKRVEERLRLNESQLRLITDNIPSIITSMDSEQRYKFVNKAYEDFYGYKGEDVLGKYIFDVIVEENYRKVLPYVRAALSGEKAHYEIELSGKDGKKHYFYNEMVPEVDDRGVVKGYTLLSTDMTEFHAMERKITEALEFSQTILEASPIGISIFNASGSLVSINDAGAKIAGGTKELALQQNLDFNQYESWKQTDVLDAAKQVLMTGIPAVGQALIKSVFGKELWMDYRFSWFLSGGEPHLLMLYDDITGRKRDEESIAKLNEDLEWRALELARSNKELESFSYSVSHDLGAPLRIIDAYSQFLLEDYEDKLDPEAVKQIQIIRSQCRHMSNLIKDLLELSRLTRKAMLMEELDLSEIAESVAAELKAREPERQVAFDIAPGLRVYGDRALLQSAMENLIGNAWKYTGKHARATIEFGKTRYQNEEAYFVRDDGAGFDVTYAYKLFQPFQRLHSGSDFPGNGIGLATVRRIIERHGGQIWANGELDKGAVFYFTLKTNGSESNFTGMLTTSSRPTP
jgi:PAS domain S-box-containing protein